MQRVLKWLLILFGLALIVVVIGVYGAVNYLHSSKFKQDLIVEVQERTGRSLAIDSELKVSLYPWAGVEMSGVTLGNAKGFGEQPFLKADYLAVRIKTLPLLKQQYELDTLKLHGADVSLARNKEGVSNWDDLKALGGEGKEKQDTSGLAAVILGGVDIQKAKIRWDDKSTDQIHTIYDLNASTGALTFGDPIDLTLSLKTKSNRPAIDSTVNLKGNLNYDLDNELYSVKPLQVVSVLSGKNIPGGTAEIKFNTEVELNFADETAVIRGLQLDALDTHLKAEIQADKIQSSRPLVQGDINLTGQDISRLFKILEIEPLAGQLAKLEDKSFTVSTRLESDPKTDSIQVPSFNAKGLGSVIEASGSASNLQEDAPAVNAKLKAKGSDLPLLLQVLTQFGGGDTDQLAALGQDLAKTGNKGFDISTAVDADLDKGQVKVDQLSAKLLGAVIEGQLQATRINTDQPAVNGQLKASGTDLPSVMQLMASLQKERKTSADMGKAFSAVSDKSFVVDAVFDSGKKAGAIELSKFAAKAIDSTIEANVTVSNLKAETPSAKGKLMAKGNNLPALLQVLGEYQAGSTSPLATLGRDLAKTGHKDFDIATEFDADMSQGQVKVPGLSAKLLGAVISGDVTASDVQTDTPSVKGQLKASGTDLPSLLRLVGDLQQGESALSDAGKRLSSVTDKSFAAEAVFDANQKAGNIDVSRLTAKTMGVDINGRLKATGINNNKGSVDGQLSVKGTDLKDLLSAYDQKDLGEVLKSVDLNAGLKGTAQVIDLVPFELKAVLSGKDIPNSPVDVNLTGDVQANLEKQTLTIKNMKLKGLGLDASGNLNASQLNEKPEFTGDLTMTPFDLRKLLQQLNQPVPKTADQNVLKKVALTTQFNGSNDSLSLKGLTVILDDSQMKGDFAVKNFQQPAIQFGLGLNQINVDRYLPPTEGGKKAKPVTPEAAAAGAAQLPLETLRALDVQGDILIGNLIYSNLKLQNVKLSLNAKDGKIKMNPIKADLYQGNYDGNISLDATGKVPKLTLNTNMKSIQAEPLLNDLMGEAQLKGVGNINLALFSLGSDVNTLKKTLSGKGDIRFEQGVLRGVDVRKVLQQVEIMIESKRFGNIDKGQETLFDRLTATLDVDKGVVSNKDMLMTAPGFKVNGEGIMANLNDESWRYNLKVAVDETSATQGSERYNLGGYSIPVKCRGLIKDLDCNPDTGELAKVVLEKSVKEKIEESIGDALGIEKKTTTKPKADTTQPAPAPKKADPVEKLKEELLKGFGL